MKTLVAFLVLVATLSVTGQARAAGGRQWQNFDFVLSGPSWGCSDPVTWNTPNPIIRRWATPIIEEIHQISGVDLEWADDPVNSNIEIDWNDSYFGQALVEGVTMDFHPHVVIWLNHLILIQDEVGDNSPPAERYRYRKVATSLILRHELGHAMGLGHAAGAHEVMWGSINWNLTDYGPGDRAGLRAVGCRWGRPIAPQ